MLQRWWSTKYSIPWTHDLFQDQCLDELFTQWYEDLYEKHPLEAQRNENGEVQFETGDPVLDKWEEEIAAGRSINMEEAFNPDALKTIKERLERAKIRSAALGGKRT